MAETLEEKKAKAAAERAAAGTQGGAATAGGDMTEAEIMAILGPLRAQQDSRQPTYSSYDGKNNFSVPLKPAPGMNYQTGQGVYQPNGLSTSLEYAWNSGFYGVTDPELQRLVVDAAGGDPMKYDTIYKAAVQQASLMKAGGDTKVTVAGLLQKWGKSGLPDGLSGGGGGGGGGGPFRQVSRTVSLTDRGTANQIINQALTNYLGRQATDVEQKAFMKMLNVNEKANPQVAVTEGNVSADGSNRTSSTKQTGGFNRDDFAQKFAKSQEGYAEYQAATTYLDAFIDGLENDTRAI